MKGWIAVMLVALSAMVAQAFGRFSYGVLLPAIRDDLQISNSLAGSLGAANVGAYLLGTLAVAWATGHFRLINCLRLGLVLAILGLTLAAYASNPTTLALGLFLTGLGGAFVWVPAPIIAADAVQQAQRGLAVGLMGSGMGVGILFTGILSANLRASLGDSAWHTAYGIQSAVGLIVLLGVAFFVRHQQQQPTTSAGIGGFSALQRMPGWRPLLLAYASFGFMYLLIIGFLTTRLEDDSGWSAQRASLAFTLLGIAMIVGGPGCIAIANRLGHRRTLTVAFSLWSLLVLVVLGGWLVPTLGAVIGLGLLFTAIPSLITLYVVNHSSARDYGPTYAAATLAFGVAQMLSPQVGGWLADLTGSFAWVFGLSSAIGFLGLLAILKLPK
jgi:predicted MFS family arabinose efflux permease